MVNRRMPLGLVLALACIALARPATGQSLWRGSMELDGRPLPVLASLELQPESVSMTLHLVEFGLMNLEFVERPGEGDGVWLRCPLGPGAMLLHGEFEDDEHFAGRWSWGPRSGAFALARDAEETFPYREIELTVPVQASAGQPAFELAATLLLPTGPGPFPAVVWTHGSGSMGRQSSTYVREPYRLALEGVASIVYDKRGVGASGGDWTAASFHDLAADAVAVRRSLQGIPGIDQARVGIAGISQGPSWIAPIAIGMTPGFSFFISISATTDPPPLQHLHVVENRLRKAGFSNEVIARVKALHTECDRWQRLNEGGSVLEAKLREVQGEAWFSVGLLPKPPLVSLSQAVRSWMWVDPMIYWSDLDLPIFACWGSADEISDPVRSARMIRESLGDTVSLHTYPGASHEMRVASISPPSPLIPGFHADLLDWLERVAPSEKRSSPADEE